MNTIAKHSNLNGIGFLIATYLGFELHFLFYYQCTPVACTTCSNDLKVEYTALYRHSWKKRSMKASISNITFGCTFGRSAIESVLVEMGTYDKLFN